MYNLLIVEDEAEIREGIENCIREKASYFNIKTAKNGLKALEIITQEKIDAMILDIRMPVMDGVDLLKELRQRGIALTTVVLSGHDEFEYAKAALEYGASKYLLKPVTPQDIIDIANEIKRNLDDKASRKFELENLRQQVRQNLNLLKERFFNDLISGKVSNEIFESKIKFFNINIKSDLFQAAILDISYDQTFSGIEEREMLNQYIEKLLSDLVQVCKDFNVFFAASEQIVLLFEKTDDDREEDVLDELGHIKNEIEKAAPIVATIGVGRIYKGIAGIRKTYIEALNSVKHKIIMGEGSIIPYWNITADNGMPGISFEIEEFKINLRLCLREKLYQMLNNFFDSFMSCGKNVTLDCIYSYCNLILALVSAVLSESGKLLSEVFPEYVNPYAEIYRFSTIDEIKEWMVKLIDRCIDHIERLREKRSRNIVEMAKKIIIENYREDITTKYLSDRLFLNQDYLGRIFKGETGMTVSDYVNKVRVKKAMELLKNPKYMVYEVARMVGFSDQHYFSTVFRKVTGLTPSQYKEV
ncbi:MAG TPA: response regulator [Clostridiaceae bacterium]|nr:response regulator [Clostridiaceae bacterium]